MFANIKSKEGHGFLSRKQLGEEDEDAASWSHCRLVTPESFTDVLNSKGKEKWSVSELISLPWAQIPGARSKTLKCNALKHAKVTATERNHSFCILFPKYMDQRKKERDENNTSHYEEIK